ncbi:MAG TPA: CBS domain-containing protein [Thermoanaerobaculia bacterium]|nr:CBS domain-containing protein [Thermoanaerobaculia bacterium]
MKVKEIMMSNPVTCAFADNLAFVTTQMWDNDCGILPVIENGRVQAVITDRDVCMALTFKGARPEEVTVADVVQGHVLYGCSPDMEVRDALKIMRDRKVRRLPVMDDGKLEGIVSMNDVVFAAREKGEAPIYADVVDALKGICSHGSEVAIAA